MEKSSVNIEGIEFDLFKCDVIVVGSGAAGLNCANRLYDEGIRDIAILTSDLYNSTSYKSGSDKQTYYKLSVFGDIKDSPIDMAHSLFDGGSMHGDIAYIESIYSLQAFYKLVEAGVPFPFNKYGAYVGYKTDHDPRQRATSAGPRTSRYMVEKSLLNIENNRIIVFNNTTVVNIATDNDAKKQVCGVVAIRKDHVDKENFGITMYAAGAVVLATGGPGELYKYSVYPEGQFSLHGVALEAGASLVNLGESQFGITSKQFRWNLSGTYQQAIPSFFSVDSAGNRFNFLEDYYRNVDDLALNIFLKGYQWPFNASRTLNYGSSIIDLAIHSEIQNERKVFMDFNNNPMVHGYVFEINNRGSNACEYLKRSKAIEKAPYDRLFSINPESIQLFRDQNIDIKDPLEIQMSFQHNNGGIEVDCYYQTCINYLFAIGEIAGVHGVTRPGGTALNSGQVGGIRVSQYLKMKGIRRNSHSELALLIEKGNNIYNETMNMLVGDKVNHYQLRIDMQKRMSDHAAFIRNPMDIQECNSCSGGITRDMLVDGLGADGNSDIIAAWETRNLLITHAAFMKSIEYYINDKGGSRGSYIILDDREDPDSLVVETAKGKMYSIRKDDSEHRKQKIKINGIDFKVSIDNVRPIPDDDSWFETTWSDWNDNNIL
jgi:succinate dehydrogenase/fumarate reductase flavoprotein subunit